jgi:hypothetical protein
MIINVNVIFCEIFKKLWQNIVFPFPCKKAAVIEFFSPIRQTNRGTGSSGHFFYIHSHFERKNFKWVTLLLLVQAALV